VVKNELKLTKNAYKPNKGAQFKLTGFPVKEIYLSPLSFDTMMTIVDEQCNFNGQWNQFISSRYLQTLVGDQGGIVRNLESIVEWIRGSTPNSRITFGPHIGEMTRYDAPSTGIPRRDYKVRQLELFIGVTGLYELISYGLTRIPVDWETKIGGKTILEIATFGHISPTPSSESPGVFSLHIPAILLAALSEHLKNKLLQAIVPYPPPIEDWKEFERLTLIGFLALRVNLLHSRSGQCQISELFPGCMNETLKTKMLNLKEVKVGKEKAMWIYTPRSGIFFIQQLHIFLTL
jgi:hypothetical protein